MPWVHGHCAENHKYPYSSWAIPAEAGEFTLRAFLHGRIDLTQAEAVADLIASKSEHDRTIALNQMRGGFRNQLKNLRSELVKFKALVELELDFGEETWSLRNAKTTRLNRTDSIRH